MEMEAPFDGLLVYRVPILSTKPWDVCGGGKKMMPVLANVEIGPRMFFPPGIQEPKGKYV